MTKKFMEFCVQHLGNEQERMKYLNRTIEHFNSEKTNAEKTLEELEKLKNV